MKTEAGSCKEIFMGVGLGVQSETQKNFRVVRIKLHKSTSQATF